MTAGRKDDGHGTAAQKDRWDLLPTCIVYAVKVLTHGAAKYQDHNWQHVKDARQRYYSALMRHLFAWFSGELIDPESGLPHLAHVIVNALFLLWFDEQEGLNADK